ncbi:MAG TPA: helix-turn-helix transcriptional regulator [Candidatus Limnocylindrales bacterium]|nr:helix-turn-helix transcriptional regulator [Candidatus Limnocylindrales bacterium]
MAWSDYGEWLADPDVRKGMELIGAAVKRRRRQKFLSQARLAQMTGIPQSTISRFENGRRCGLSWVRFARLVGVLGGLDFGSLVRPFIPGFEHQLQPNPYLERQRLEAARQALRADAASAASAIPRGADELALRRRSSSPHAHTERNMQPDGIDATPFLRPTPDERLEPR